MSSSPATQIALGISLCRWSAEPLSAHHPDFALVFSSGWRLDPQTLTFCRVSLHFAKNSCFFASRNLVAIWLPLQSHQPPVNSDYMLPELSRIWCKRQMLVRLAQLLWAVRRLAGTSQQLVGSLNSIWRHLWTRLYLHPWAERQAS